MTLLAIWVPESEAPRKEFSMGTDPPDTDAALRMYPVQGAEHLRFIAVEGELWGSNSRWAALLRGIVEQRFEGIVVDLRGCQRIDAPCVEALLAAAATIKARGGSGIALVTLSGSKLDRRLRLLVGDEMPVCDGTEAAAQALGERRMPPPALVSLEHEEGAVIVSLNGEIDRASKDEFSAALEEGLSHDRPLIVDLEQCSFMDSSGIGLLVRTHRRASHGRFALVAGGPQVHRILDLVGIPDFLPTFDTRLEAIGAFAS
jgi:anti-anti-sigma factor